MPKTKLNIYLIKDHITDPKKIINEEDGIIKKLEIPEVGTLYYKISEKNEPDWINSFFRNEASIKKIDLFTSSISALLLLKNKEENGRYFAITFGTGRFLLFADSYEERFGIITTLNLVEDDKIRGIDKRTLSSNPKISREQLSKTGRINDFDVDLDRDLINSLTGISTNNAIEGTITGRAALSVSTKADISNIKAFLNKCIKIYKGKQYQTNFNWVDKIKNISDLDTIKKLDMKLIKRLVRKDPEIIFAIPEMVNWSETSSFTFSSDQDKTPYSDFDITTFYKFKPIANSLTKDFLVKAFIEERNSDGEQMLKWSYYSCLIAEIENNKKKYILNNSKWYEVDLNFVRVVDNYLDSIKLVSLKMPNYKENNIGGQKYENKYNNMAATVLHALCLDGQLIYYGGDHSSIEFCDIFTKRRELIHVKKYYNSFVLSHLFNQGLVSAEIFLEDQDFRNKVKEKIKKIEKIKKNKYSNLIPKDRPKTKAFTIIYAIIKKDITKKTMGLPFFSKLSLKNACRKLNNYGYNVNLCFIEDNTK